MHWRFEEYETLGSTSDLCKSRAENGEPTGLAVLARLQSAGRGTRGRDWVDPGGNLAFSFLIRAPEKKSPLLILPFLVAISLYEAVTAHVELSQRKRFSLKWPNDLLLDDGKLAGILIESGGSADDRWIVIGIGANLSVAPQIPGRLLKAFSEIAPALDPMELAKQIVARVSVWLDRWALEGFAPIRDAWLSYAHPVGRCLAVQTRETYITGKFSGLDERGCLLLELQDGGIMPVVTGDIFLG